MPDPTTTAPIDDRMQKSRADLLARSAPGALLFTIALTALISAVLWPLVAHTWILAWALYMGGVSLARYLQIRSYAAATADADAVRSFNKWFVVGVLSAGVGWGAAGAFLFPPDDLVYQSFLSFILAGITAASVTVYGPVKRALRLFVLVALLPLAASHFVGADQIHIVMGAAVTCYMIFLYHLASIMHESLMRSLTLRFENEDLINELQVAKHLAEDTNQKLKAEISIRNRSASELMEARDKAQQATRVKSDFLATMSHEIRTPMNGVLGMTELLMNTELTAKQYRFADTIRRSGEALLAIINDILDFSKIEAGKLEIQHTVFDLRQLVEDTMAFFAESAHRKKIELVTMYPPEEHAAYRGDPQRIRQILMNLIANAIKFTDRGEIVVKVATLQQSEESSTLKFEVADTGVGIKNDHQGRIFDSFQQADGSTTRKFGGTGLGLAICRRLVELMHGSIGVESRENVGSTFWFSIELSTMPESSISGQIKPDLDLSGIRVLVVDGNETSRDILKHQLSNWDMKFHAASSAAHAMKYLKKGADLGKTFDLTIIDHQLPDSDGVDLARRIKSDSAIADTRLIMLSSIDQLDQTGQWYLAGIEVYINKPIRQVELYDAVSNALSECGPGSTSQPQRRTSKKALAEKQSHEIGAHVLLAEDNPVNKELARAMLEDLGCTIVVVGDGREAVEAIAEAPLDRKQRRYDVVLMDCQMPRMDGFEATLAIRQWEADNGEDTPLPIVAVTANAMEGDRDRCLAAGMSDYLSKPFGREQLAKIVKRWMTVDVEMTHLAKQREQKRSALPVRENSSADVLADLDHAALNNIRALQRDGSNAILAKIIGMYLTNSPKLLEKLQEAAVTGNGELMRASAHSLKSASANLGASRLAELCEELEDFGRNDNAISSLATLGIVEFEFEAVCNALSLELDDKAA